MMKFTLEKKDLPVGEGASQTMSYDTESLRKNRL